MSAVGRLVREPPRLKDTTLLDSLRRTVAVAKVVVVRHQFPLFNRLLLNLLQVRVQHLLAVADAVTRTVAEARTRARVQVNRVKDVAQRGVVVLLVRNWQHVTGAGQRVRIESD